MWDSLRAGVRSEIPRPSEHADNPESGGAFQGFATHGGFGAASEWGAPREFATLVAREAAQEWRRSNAKESPRAGARLEGARPEEGAG